MENIKESDLSAPIVSYFESLGAVVHCEVKDCDMTAQLDDRLIVVEIKKSFNAKLLFQAIDRQRFADEVYIAVPKPKRITKDVSKMRHIAEKLDLGLIFVTIGNDIQYIDILCEPNGGKIKNNRRKRFVVEELSGRSLNVNTAGTTKEKLATAYREKCIQIAAILYYEKEITTGILKDKYKIENSGTILIKNFYGWFDRVDKGTYALSNSVAYEMEDGKWRSLFQLYLEKYKDFPQADEEN